MLRVGNMYSILPLNLKWWNHNTGHRVTKQEVYYHTDVQYLLALGYVQNDVKVLILLLTCTASTSLYSTEY